MRTVGWGPVPAVGTYAVTGNQWARMTVPSNEVMFQSVVDPATGVALTGLAGSGRLHVVGSAEAAVVVVDDADDEQPARVATTHQGEQHRRGDGPAVPGRVFGGGGVHRRSVTPRGGSGNPPPARGPSGRI